MQCRPRPRADAARDDAKDARVLGRGVAGLGYEAAADGVAFHVVGVESDA